MLSEIMIIFETESSDVQSVMVEVNCTRCSPDYIGEVTCSQT
jgi:hypothetical protein